ncbi:hypothetical protein CORT_0C03340 [Candida orthopsilosis Co 90-125]|uniref:Uncharacterized protein n=1 Tax=Candida orthopsilosis (strain 90-125) TaxID=1136231 RepID=H8X3S1_CANO9|nr:hypothetical protein CORT_0C03340 [Candida orthopsilosis Co 90-125]CCG25709.1 hypothetical protein CORT_0C03340 [Candida orthopsilosis Co 90-125]
MSRPLSPPSPVHPAPNEELRPNSLPTSQLQNDDLDLNPDLYDDEEEDTDGIGNDATTEHSPTTNVQLSIPKDAQQEEANHNTLMADLSDSHEFDKVDLQSIRQITLPFDEEYQLFKTTANAGSVGDELSSQQQSKFINYIDDQLLQIQRKFIKQQSTEDAIYPFTLLIKDLDSIFDIIWVSISRNQHPQKSLIGQEEYYIKMLGDLEDYITHYKTLFDENWQLNSKNQRILKADFNKIVVVCKFLSKMDLQLSFIKDNGFFNSTQCVRLKMIIERLRYLIMDKFEIVVQIPRLRNVLEVEASRIFEGILERLNG